MLDVTNLRHIIMIVIICTIITLLLNFYIKKIAIHIGAMDMPNERKVHEKPMPRLGGLGIFIGFLIGYMLFGVHSIQMNSILIGGFIIVITGVIDDIKPVKASTKLFAQLFAALILILYGNILMQNATIFNLNINFGILAYPITIFFILGCINVINLIDGLDGLAAGTSSIFFLTISIIAYLKGSTEILSITLALIMLGSTIGFLFHNFYPASIFMGDSGSMFEGFMIAVISLLGFKTTTVISFLVPILILGIPILDTLFAIIRRLIKKQPIYLPDKQHLHHQLLNMGISHRNTVLIIYAMNILFASASILYILKDKVLGKYLYLTIFVLVVWLVLRTSIIKPKKRK